MELFETISEDEFLAETEGEGQAAIPEDLPDLPLVWCEFCKGYFIEEYHVERMDVAQAV